MSVQKNKKLNYRRNGVRRRSLHGSRSFKVTNFDTNRKPVCSFILVNNINLVLAARRHLFVKGVHLVGALVLEDARRTVNLGHAYVVMLNLCATNVIWYEFGQMTLRNNTQTRLVPR